MMITALQDPPADTASRIYRGITIAVSTQRRERTLIRSTVVKATQGKWVGGLVIEPFKNLNESERGAIH